MKIKNLCYSLLIGACLAQSSYAQLKSLPADVKVTSSIKTLTVEQTYPMVISKLAAPLVFDIKKVGNRIDKFQFPHVALQEQFVAMKSANYKTFMGTWSKDSQTEMNQRNSNSGRSENFWLNLWQSNLKSATTIEVRTVIAYSKYILLEYFV